MRKYIGLSVIENIAFAIQDIKTLPSPDPIKDIKESIELIKKMNEGDSSSIDRVNRLSNIEVLTAEIKHIKPGFDFVGIEIYSSNLGMRYEDVLLKIKNLLLQFQKPAYKDFGEKSLKASDAVHKFSVSVFTIDNDNRPFYQKMQEKGGKKRKQHYYNRQPRRK